jgi:hypothetical protein
MVVIELRSPMYDPSTQVVTRELVAVIEVGDAGIRVVRGDPEWINIAGIVVDHPQTKEDLTFADDPELWAMTVPEAFRSDVVAEARLEKTGEHRRSTLERYLASARPAGPD